MRLELTIEEVELVRDLLERAYGDLRMEISATDSFAYRQGLHARERLLEGILQRVRRPPGETEAGRAAS